VKVLQQIAENGGAARVGWQHAAQQPAREPRGLAASGVDRHGVGSFNTSSSPRHMCRRIRCDALSAATPLALTV
jgi:hypothetical protein